jgi:hypothetical protein
VTYEELVRDSLNFHLLWDFLSINSDGKTPSSNFVKIRKAGYCEVISNYDEVKEALAGTEFVELID